MRIEALKKGQPYNVRLLFQEIDCDNDCVFIDPVGLSKIYLSLSNAPDRVTPISSPSAPPTLVGTTPKYDPCRKFRKGDIVEPTKINGRLPQELRGCYRYEVIVGEGEMSNPLYVALNPLLTANYKHFTELRVNVAFLKLVTPVEELEPYYVKDDGTHYVVGMRPEQPEIVYLAEYSKDLHPHAKEAAEAERDRLNAEHRKEQQ